MKVKELIRKLKKINQDMEVWTVQALEYDNAEDVRIEWFSPFVPLYHGECEKIYNGKLTQKQLFEKIKTVDEEIKNSFLQIVVIE